MLPPVRCFTCNKPLSAIWDTASEKTGDERSLYLRQVTVRYCCRMALLTCSDMTSVVSSPHERSSHPAERQMLDMRTVAEDERVVPCR